MRPAMALVLLVLACAGQVRADLVDYNYEVRVTPAQPYTPGSPYIELSSGHIALVFQADTHRPTTLGALHVQAYSPPGSPPRTYNEQLRLSVDLFDIDALQHRTLTFDATLRGTLTPTSSTLTFALTHPGTGWTTLGGYEWGLTFDPVLKVPSPTTWGGAELRATLKVTHGPEPSTLLLGTAGSLLALGWLRRQKRRRAASQLSG